MSLRIKGKNDPEKQVKKAARSGFFGAIAEYYDFGLYGTASAVIFPTVFFGAGNDPATAAIASLASFGVAYLARPAGAIFFGYLGDTWGRKNALMVTLGLMGFATLVIGFLPSYETIGPAAAVILIIMRLAQGFSAGGEQAGSNTLTSEWAPPARRGHYTAYTMHGLAIGQLAAMGAFIPFSGSDEFLYGIGWRIPYWIAIPVVLYALWIRTKVDEPPKKTDLGTEETVKAKVTSIEQGASPSDAVVADTATAQTASSIAVTKSHQSAKKGTISHLFKNHWPNVIRVILMGQYAITGALMGTYGLNYGSTYWDLDKPRLLTVATLSLFIGLLVQPLWANLSDKIGRRPVYLSSMIGLLIMFPLIFWSLQSKNWYLIFATYLIAGLIMTGGNVVQAALYTELFPKEVRMSGYAISTQIGNIFVGFTPMIAAILVRPGAFGWIPVLIFTTTMMGLGVIACFTTRETSGTELD